MDDARLRRLACCASEPPCILCPLLPANAGRSLKELALLGLKANLDQVDLDASAA
jgi:hypothetical protein